MVQDTSKRVRDDSGYGHFLHRGAGYGSHTDTNLGSDFRAAFGHRLAVMLTA